LRNSSQADIYDALAGLFVLSILKLIERQSSLLFRLSVAFGILGTVEGVYPLIEMKSPVVNLGFLWFDFGSGINIFGKWGSGIQGFSYEVFGYLA
jgi:hypothetical protein